MERGEHQTPTPFTPESRKRRLRLMVAAVCVVFGVFIGIVAFEVIDLSGKDARAWRMARILAARIRSRDPQFKDVVENLHSWRHAHPQRATTTERIWNRMYPAVVGKVKNEAELAALRDLINAVCDEYQYDPQLVVVRVQVEP